MRPHRIKELRERNKFTQESLAKEIGVSPSTVGGYENTGRLPDLETLKKIAQLFDVSLDYLAGYTDVPYTLTNAEKFAISEDEIDFMAVYRKLEATEKEALYQFVRLLVEKE